MGVFYQIVSEAKSMRHGKFNRLSENGIGKSEASIFIRRKWEEYPAF
jgi:hypothetical protein